MRVRSVWLAIVACMHCGGEIDTADAGTCAPNEQKSGCPCTAPPGTIENACACAVLPGCDGGTRWACYPLGPSCPATTPAVSSSCTTAGLTCDYARADGTADERICEGNVWNSVSVTTFCP